MPKIFGKQIGTVVRAPRGVGASSPKKVGKHLNTLLDRGTKQVQKRDNSKTATPKGYGGSPTITRYPNSTSRKGSGANRGAGDTTGYDA